MTLTTIAIFACAAVFYSFMPPKSRVWGLFIGSILAVYWLQPQLQIRWLDFVLPTLSLILTCATWYLTRSPEQPVSRVDKIAFALTCGLIVVLSALRFVPESYRFLVASRPPNPLTIGLFLIVSTALILLWKQAKSAKTLLLIFIILLFIILKTEAISLALSALLRQSLNMESKLANPLDLNWLGFSYLAFRLIHTVRDRQSGILPEINLRDYLSYVFFFPTLIAGPIDRAERFLKDIQALETLPNFDAARFIEGSTRILIGLGKKFVIADSLAQGIALNPLNASQATETYGLWLLVYGYAFRLFFDFSGYSDIAIGIGILFGIKAPENFDRPYLQTSITKFWQSWHMTLSSWARFYVFSPLSRSLIRLKPKPSTMLIVLVSQVATMLVIGLWHGVAWNFAVWGLWHGLGLWIHKQWTDNTRSFYRDLQTKPHLLRLADGLAWFVTFHFVVLGWIAFALPLEQALQVFALLFGIRV